jgi:hypothetical protein
MNALSLAILVTVPILVVAGVAIQLVRLGMATKELTESARQKLAGLGMLLIYLTVLACAGVFGVSFYMLVRTLRS